MTCWRDLARELDLWAATGRAATLWWRDDDAATATPALARLIELSRRRRVPVALAVIPARATEALAAAIADRETVIPVQHGYAHLSHATPGGKSGELGPSRPVAIAAGELAAGWRRMRALFDAGAAPVLVPPWNRIDPALLPYLPGLGFRGLSTYGARERAAPVAGLVQVNTHLDLIDWRGMRGFVGEAKALGQLIEHLRARRAGAADAEEPSGLLTHHLVHDTECWAFIDALFARTREHGAARWRDPREIFAVAAAQASPAASIGP